MPEDIMARIRIQAQVRDSCLIPILHTTVISHAEGLSSGRTRGRLTEGKVVARFFRRDESASTSQSAAKVCGYHLIGTNPWIQH
jgi:hypothetical protein